MNMTGASKHEERVLGLPTDRFHSAGLFQGFRPFDAALFAVLLDPAYLEYRARGHAEVDPSFKQLIPYVVLRHQGRLFQYTRGKHGAEARLRAKRSVGIGGHISLHEDAASADPYRAGMMRELAEEVCIDTAYRESMFGLINDDSTPVGTVHLGVVHLLDLDEPRVAALEPGIVDAGFEPLPALQTRLSEFESWSQFVIHALS